MILLEIINRAVLEALQLRFESILAGYDSLILVANSIKNLFLI